MVLDSSDSLSKALAELDETPAVLVTRNGAYLGIIDHRCLSQGIRDPRKVKCETVIAKPPVLNEAASVDDRVDAFLLGHFKALPVVDSEKRPLGITTRVELLKEMVVDSRIPAMQADEIMSSPVFTIDEGDTIASAKRILREKGAHRLAVTRKGKLIGVVSTFDIGAWSSKTNMPGGRKDIRLSESLSTDAMPISSFLRPDVSLVKAGASLEESARRMIDKQVSAVIVVSDGKPLGVISALDIFRKV
jgi:CBS domain-containing protein